VQHNLDHVVLLLLQHLLDGRPALRRGDILLKSDAPANGPDGNQVDADDQAPDRHVLGAHLHPSPRRGAEVEHGARGGQELELAVQLHELEGGSRAEALLLGEVVEPVEASLPRGLALPHRGRRSGWKEIRKMGRHVGPDFLFARGARESGGALGFRV
jgi:hypothetical protein